MSSPRDKILELVAGGKIQADEADQLLAALKPDRSRLDVWILDPFEVIGPGRAWMLAILVCLGSLALAPLHVRFDGAVDLHVIGQQVDWTTALADQLVAWPLTALVFWGVTAITNRRARLLEMVAFVGAARLPNLVAGLVTAAVVGDPTRFDFECRAGARGYQRPLRRMAVRDPAQRIPCRVGQSGEEARGLVRCRARRRRDRFEDRTEGLVMNQNGYKRTQVGWVIIVTLALAILFCAITTGTAPTVRFVVVGALAMCLFLFSTLTVVGSRAGLEVRFGPGVIRRRFAWSEIREARPVRNSWLTGWGIRWTGSGWLFNVSGLDAVELSLKTGKRFRIGTDDPRGLHTFIVQHLEHIA